MSIATNEAKAEFADDLQVGLARSSVPEFGELPLVGMAAKLAVNIRVLAPMQI